MRVANNVKPRILVIGTGSIGTRHGNNLALLGAEPICLSIRQLSEQGVIEAIGKTPDVQGAVIATATQLRQPLIEALSARAFPVYVEKPVAFEPKALDAFYAAASQPDRSMVGFMMRYHPILPHLLERSQEDMVYRFDFEIGQDVTQWRQNWSFASSYSAKPAGGGVLLDLCHELDLAQVLFPNIGLQGVNCLGHSGFPGVDMATQIVLSGPLQSGLVSMDYLSPVSLRKIRMRGQMAVTECDLLTGTLICQRPNQAPHVTQVDFERNEMFLDAMRDFLALVSGSPPPSHTPRIPRLDLCRGHCELIARAWEMRRFDGMISKELT